MTSVGTYIYIYMRIHNPGAVRCAYNNNNNSNNTAKRNENASGEKMMVGQRKDASVSYFAVATMCLFSIPHGASRRSSDDFLAGCVCVCVLCCCCCLSRTVGGGGWAFICARSWRIYLYIVYCTVASYLRSVCTGETKQKKQENRTRHGTERTLARAHRTIERVHWGGNGAHGAPVGSRCSLCPLWRCAPVGVLFARVRALCLFFSPLARNNRAGARARMREFHGAKSELRKIMSVRKSLAWTKGVVEGGGGWGVSRRCLSHYCVERAHKWCNEFHLIENESGTRIRTHSNKKNVRTKSDG